MTAPDTSAAAVERLAKQCEACRMYAAAVTLRAFAAERDQWIANSRENKLIAEANLRERDTAQAKARRLREALLRWRNSGCPDCGGDCAGANPPVSCCIMRETEAALKTGEAE